MKIPIVYEDKNFLVIDKPSGLVVNRAESVKEATLQDWAEEKLKAQSSKLKTAKETDFYERSGIVHRLDKETSGLLVIAKNSNTFAVLQSQFKNRAIIKRYIALVHGKILADGEIKATVGRLPWNRERFGVLAGGREAVTSFRSLKLLKSLKGEIYTLVEVNPLTGRTHQIRIHFKYLGYPVVSDKFYAGRKIYKSDIAFCKRLFLHANYIKFKNPEGGNWLEYYSKLPNDLDEVLRKLQEV